MARLFSLNLLFCEDRHGSLRLSKKLTSVKILLPGELERCVFPYILTLFSSLLHLTLLFCRNARCLLVTFSGPFYLFRLLSSLGFRGAIYFFDVFNFLVAVFVFISRTWFLWWYFPRVIHVSFSFLNPIPMYHYPIVWLSRHFCVDFFHWKNICTSIQLRTKDRIV